jgi:hypothetical protein
MKVTPVTEYINKYRQNWLQHVKRNVQSQDSETNVLICPHWTTTARKTEEKIVGDCNRTLGLILHWKMMKKTELKVGTVSMVLSADKVWDCSRG